MVNIELTNLGLGLNGSSDSLPEKFSTAFQIGIGLRIPLF